MMVIALCNFPPDLSNKQSPPSVGFDRWDLAISGAKTPDKHAGQGGGMGRDLTAIDAQLSTSRCEFPQIKQIIHTLYTREKTNFDVPMNTKYEESLLVV